MTLVSEDTQNTFTYNSVGNPLSYYNNKSNYTFTWGSNNTLASAVKDSVTTSYTYNTEGIRTGKTVGSETHQYTLSGSTILAEVIGGTTLVKYYYDDNGSPSGMNYAGTDYYFVKNEQGDITEIRTTNGTVVGSYRYDAWGNVAYISGTIAAVNPFRYRGYYYDTDTGFYYLNSRYYDPAVRRFISADAAEYLGATGTYASYNLFAYCENNPVENIDPSGYWSIAGFANSLNPSTIFASFMMLLYQDLTAALVQVGLFVTKTLLPKVAAALWYQPWAVVGIVAAAVAIVIAAVVIVRNVQLDKIKNSISTRIKNSSGKIDLGKFSKKPGSGPPRWIGPLGYELVKDMSEHKGPAYKLFKYGVRIATILLDGTIIGK